MLEMPAETHGQIKNRLCGNYQMSFDRAGWKFFDLGRISFTEGRDFQQSLLRARIDGAVGDAVICCEHSPTLSLGRRTENRAEFLAHVAEWRSLGVELEQVSRGGGVTFHGPGQLVVYPVVGLRERGMGVEKFVCAGLKSLKQVLAAFGVESSVLVRPAGLWVGGGESGKKIASVGLHIERGVTNHGFSLNVNCDLEMFKKISPCGLSGERVTSLQSILGTGCPEMSEVCLVFQDAWVGEFSDVP